MLFIYVHIFLTAFRCFKRLFICLSMCFSLLSVKPLADEPACAMDIDEASLFAALAKHPRSTAGSDGHPMPDRCRASHAMDIPKVKHICEIQNMCLFIFFLKQNIVIYVDDIQYFMTFRCLGLFVFVGWCWLWIYVPHVCACSFSWDLCQSMSIFFFSFDLP